MDLRKLSKNFISKNSHGYSYSESNKDFWFHFYMDYFIKLMTNYYEWDGLPPSVDKLFLEKKLITLGHVGFFEDKDMGLVCTGGALGHGLDIYENPIKFNPTTPKWFLKKSYDVHWYSDDLIDGKAVIIQNDNYRQPSTTWLMGFCSKLADIEQTIQLNRNAQIMPYVVIAEDSNIFSMKNFINKIMNGDPVIYVKARKNRDGDMEDKQLQDMVNVLKLEAPFLLDKLHDEKQRVINQVLTMIGINNNAVDKAERLVKAEATSNNGLVNASIEINLNARRDGVERLNRYFDLSVEVKPNENIKMFNTEQVFEDLNNLNLNGGVE